MLELLFLQKIQAENIEYSFPEKWHDTVLNLKNNRSFLLGRMVR